MSMRVTRNIRVSCVVCGHIWSTTEPFVGKLIACPICGAEQLSRPLRVVQECKLRELSKDKAPIPIFIGKHFYHKPAHLHSVPPLDQINSDLKIEVSKDRLEDLTSRCDLHVILDDIRSQWNIGSIFRTSDAAGWSSVALTGVCATPPSTGIAKTALGAETWLPWSYHAEIISAIKEKQHHGVEVFALELTKDAEPLSNFIPPKRLALVLGNEVSGVSPEALTMCNRRIFIPMLGRKGSLNVSVAFGIAAFAIAAKWRELYS